MDPSHGPCRVATGGGDGPSHPRPQKPAGGGCAIHGRHVTCCFPGASSRGGPHCPTARQSAAPGWAPCHPRTSPPFGATGDPGVQHSPPKESGQTGVWRYEAAGVSGALRWMISPHWRRGAARSGRCPLRSCSHLRAARSTMTMMTMMMMMMMMIMRAGGHDVGYYQKYLGHLTRQKGPLLGGDGLVLYYCMWVHIYSSRVYMASYADV